MILKRILTIAGSDSGGGAGIQADLKTITALGGFGMCAITALTAQNTVGVRRIAGVPPDFVGEQIDVVCSDIGVDATKTGMLANAEIVEVVAERIEALSISSLVVDPVMISKSGHRLLEKSARDAFIRRILPLALLVTPNLHEADDLVGRPVETVKEMEDAARAICDLGAKSVLVKGGHLAGDALDVLLHEGQITRLVAPRLDSRNTHGTGCSYSAAIATELAKSGDLVESVRQAKRFITAAIAHGLSIGRGHGPTNPMAGAAAVGAFDMWKDAPRDARTGGRL